MAHWSQSAQLAADAKMRDAPPEEIVTPCGASVHAWCTLAEVPEPVYFATEVELPEAAYLPFFDRATLPMPPVCPS